MNPTHPITFSLAGKSAIVTGGCSGIGLAIARRFREHDVHVLIADRRPDGAAVAEKIGAEFQLTDVSVEAELEAAFAAAGRLFGQAHILVNNAGIQPLGVAFEEVTGPLLERTFAVNVNGVAFGLKYAGRHLADGGRVINLASFVGLIGVPRGTAYAASKA
ncbi:MAG: SDR family NAD(P)-dependent oxidoreductase, partial [Verrucomicrobiota bacterium]